jgi:hypothetical protein
MRKSTASYASSAAQSNLEHPRDLHERAGGQKHGDKRSSHQRPQRTRSHIQQVHALPNSDEVSGNVERVRNNENADQRADRYLPARLEVNRDQLAESLARGKRGPIANLLNTRHQRERHERDPQHREAEPSARLRVGSYPGRIVVRRARDQTRPKRLKVRPPPGRAHKLPVRTRRRRESALDFRGSATASPVIWLVDHPVVRSLRARLALRIALPRQ